MPSFCADERCGEAILEFLRTTEGGRKVPTEKATEAESSESEECPRGECVCGLCFYLAGSGAA